MGTNKNSVLFGFPFPIKSFAHWVASILLAFEENFSVSFIVCFSYYAKVGLNGNDQINCPFDIASW